MKQEKETPEVVASVPTTATQKFDINKGSYVKVRKGRLSVDLFPITRAVFGEVFI